MTLESIEQIRVLGSSLNILYVEDDLAIREQINALLKRIFINVDLAGNGEEAFEMYEKKSYDLVLTDIEMPKMNGIILSKKIIAKNPQQRILIISAHENIDQLIDLIDIGIDGLILKPVDIGKFIQKINYKVKEIYAYKMMKSHYEEMKIRIGNDEITYDQLKIKDPLTSVYNFSHLQNCIKNDDVQTAVLININDFKLINDYYSHKHGNHLLYQVASILVKYSKQYSFEVFRLSADEFVLLYNKENVKSIQSDVEHILKVIENTKFNIIAISDINIQIRLSYTSSNNRLLEELNIGIEYAKKYSKKFVDYEECSAFSIDLQNIVETKKILKDALQNNMIIPVYQPILLLNKDVKYEVLMRIKDSENRLLTPDKFLDIAKEHNYYNEISEMLIFKALENIAKRDEVFSINISYLDMKNEVFVERLENKLLKCNVAKRVIFEIIESEALDDIGIADAFIKRFKVLGVKFAIDDFGSGYSNFAYVLKLNPDFIKLDGSLIVNLLADNKIHTLVESIIDLAHKLNIEIVAEYVSTQEIYNELLSMGVDAMQGYYLGKPDIEIKTIIQKDAA